VFSFFDKTLFAGEIFSKSRKSKRWFYFCSSFPVFYLVTGFKFDIENQLSPGIRKLSLLTKVFSFVNLNKSKTAFGILIK